jgi:hypothetical protein
MNDFSLKQLVRKIDECTEIIDLLYEVNGKKEVYDKVKNARNIWVERLEKKIMEDYNEEMVDKCQKDMEDYFREIAEKINDRI